MSNNSYTNKIIGERLMAISTIERNKPPYRVVYEYFRKRTESAGDGMLIPPRSKLAEQFNVAEGTITRAIELLKKNGFAYGQQGRGTYICERKRKSSKLQQIGFCTHYCPVISQTTAIG